MVRSCSRPFADRRQSRQRPSDDRRARAYIAAFAEPARPPAGQARPLDHPPAPGARPDPRARQKAGVVITRRAAGAHRVFLHLCDIILVMTVNPGFGGQSFLPRCCPRSGASRDVRATRPRSGDRGRWRRERENGGTGQLRPRHRDRGRSAIFAPRSTKPPLPDPRRRHRGAARASNTAAPPSHERGHPPSRPSRDALKRAAAEAAVGGEGGHGRGPRHRLDGAFAVEALARRHRQGLRFVGIPTSERTARRRGRPAFRVVLCGASPDRPHDRRGRRGRTRHPEPDQGLGGALLREKIVANASRRLAIVVDGAKRSIDWAHTPRCPSRSSPSG